MSKSFSNALTKEVKLIVAIMGYAIILMNLWLLHVKTFEKHPELVEMCMVL